MTKVPASCGCQVDERGFCFRCGKCTRNAKGHCLCGPYRGATGPRVDAMIRREREADRRSPAQIDADEAWNQRLERERNEADG